MATFTSIFSAIYMTLGILSRDVSPLKHCLIKRREVGRGGQAVHLIARLVFRIEPLKYFWQRQMKGVKKEAKREFSTRREKLRS